MAKTAQEKLDEKKEKEYYKKHKKMYRTTPADTVFNVLNYLFFTIFTLSCIFPFYYLFINTVSDNELVRKGMVNFYPKGFNIDNYLALREVGDLGTAFLVSLSRTIIGTLLMVLASAFVGYLVTKQEMWHRSFWYRFLVITMYFNAGLIPTYLNIKNLGFMNNVILSVILPCCLGAYNIILMKSFFETIPETLYEAASLDGCTPLMTFWKVVLPLSKPALASIGLFIAVGMWNEYMHFILYIQDSRWKNFQVKVRDLILNDGISGTSITLSEEMLKSAVVIVVVLPFLLIYPFLQKYFVKGVTVGAVKG